MVAGRIDGDRLLHEDVLARLDGRRELRGAEAGGRTQQDDIRAGGDGFFIGIEADEPAFRRHIDAVAELLLEAVQGALDRLGEGVGHGHELDVAVGLVQQRIGGGARAAAAAADEGDLDLVAAGGMRRLAEFERAERGHRGRRAFDEIPAGQRERRGWCVHGRMISRVGDRSVHSGTRAHRRLNPSRPPHARTFRPFGWHAHILGGMPTSSWACLPASTPADMPTKTWACHPRCGCHPRRGVDWRHRRRHVRQARERMNPHETSSDDARCDTRAGPGRAAVRARGECDLARRFLAACHRPAERRPRPAVVDRPAPRGETDQGALDHPGRLPRVSWRRLVLEGIRRARKSSSRRPDAPPLLAGRLQGRRLAERPGARRARGARIALHLRCDGHRPAGQEESPGRARREPDPSTDRRPGFERGPAPQQGHPVQLGQRLRSGRHLGFGRARERADYLGRGPVRSTRLEKRADPRSGPHSQRRVEVLRGPVADDRRPGPHRRNPGCLAPGAGLRGGRDTHRNQP